MTQPSCVGLTPEDHAGDPEPDPWTDEQLSGGDDDGELDSGTEPGVPA